MNKQLHIGFFISLYFPESKQKQPGTPTTLRLAFELDKLRVDDDVVVATLVAPLCNVSYI